MSLSSSNQFDIIFAGCADYVNNYMIINNPKKKELRIYYVYMIYDLIDEDLDFDEEFYDNILRNLQTILIETAKEHMCSNSNSSNNKTQLDIGYDYETVLITSSKMLLATEVRLDTEVTITNKSITTVQTL